jgi:hypothetical protein
MAKQPTIGSLVAQPIGRPRPCNPRLYKTEDRAHAFSPDFVVAVWIIAGLCLDAAVLYLG